MKRITKIMLTTVLAITLATSAVVFSGCGNNRFVAHQMSSPDVFRTTGDDTIITLRTYTQFREFLNYYSDRMIWEVTDSDGNIFTRSSDFLYNLEKKYNSDFFTTSYIIIVIFTDRAYIWHEVLRVRNNGRIDIRRNTVGGHMLDHTFTKVMELPLSLYPDEFTINWSFRDLT